jgi:hypothetical protein
MPEEPMNGCGAFSSGVEELPQGNDKKQRMDV